MYGIAPYATTAYAQPLFQSYANTVSVTGVSATGVVGNVVIVVNNTCAVTGVVGYGEIGNVVVVISWGLVPTDQLPAWGDIPNTQSPGWGNINNTQGVIWTPVSTQ